MNPITNGRLRTIVVGALTAATLFINGMALADPPARVARLANIAGAVSLSPAGEDEWVLASLNRPLITGDRVWSDAGSRAELQIGSAWVRLGASTSTTILNLDDRVAQVQLAQGTLNVRVRRFDGDNVYEVDTPNLAFSIRRPGEYRIDVDPVANTTTINVFNGEGEAYGEGAAYVIGSRQRYRFAGTDLRDYQLETLAPPDEFDRWALERNRREDSAVSARYVSPEVIGYADLDDYGTWGPVEGYGNVWTPTRVDRGWAPYRDGHWAWIEPWGWTWVDDAPWGFAPFHYGRWAFARERWFWVPGPLTARPVYAPALVAFVGGTDFRLSISSGPVAGVAWFPLGPGEVYRPAYSVSRNYFTNVNVSNTTINNTYVTNVYNNPGTTNIVYRNREAPGSITAVPAAAFAGGQPVARAAVPVSRDVATRAPVTELAAVAPTRASIIARGPAGVAGSNARQPPAAALARPVVARTAPPPPPAPFATRESQLAARPGRPMEPSKAASPGSATPGATAKVNVVAPTAAVRPPPRAEVAERGKPPEADQGSRSQVGVARPPEAQKAPPQEALRAPPPQANVPKPPEANVPKPSEAQKGLPQEALRAPPAQANVAKPPPEAQKAPPQEALRRPPPQANVPKPPEAQKASPQQTVAQEKPPPSPAARSPDAQKGPPAQDEERKRKPEDKKEGGG